MADKNMQIRIELTKAGMSQTKLAELMGLSKQELSIALNVAEWSASAKKEAIQIIRDNA